MNNFFDNLDDWLLNNLSLHFDYLMNQGYLDNLFNNFFNCSVFDYWLLNNFLNFFYSISVNWFLNDDFNFNRFFDNIMNFNNFLYDLRNLNDFLNNLYNRYNFLNYSVYWLISNFNMVSNIRSWDIFNSLNNFLDNFLNFHNFWHLNPYLNNFLNNLVDWNGLLDDLSSWYNFLSYELDVSILGNWDYDLFFNLSVLLYLNRLLNKSLNLYNFWHLFNNLHNFFDYFWYFNYPLLNSRYFNQFLNNESFKSWDLDWNINSVLNDFILFNLNWGLDSPFNLNNFRNLNNLFNNFFNYLLNFNYFGCNSVNF